MVGLAVLNQTPAVPARVLPQRHRRPPLARVQATTGGLFPPATQSAQSGLAAWFNGIGVARAESARQMREGGGGTA
ncbi:hypothetical protein [Kitasatospora sp. NPDC092286]|uniref:hypothetical protein n=1 Tax=Kitasatospora sp. NPDC092286 TaxID=3364087 RepID=UPI003827ED78